MLFVDLRYVLKTTPANVPLKIMQIFKVIKIIDPPYTYMQIVCKYAGKL